MNKKKGRCSKNVVAPLKEIQEVRNAIKTYEMYPRLDAFKEKDLLKAHGVMMQALVDDASRYRRGGVGVFGEKGVVHLAPPADRVPMLMGDLFEYYDAITASTNAGQSGPFIDFMLNEIYKTLKSHQGEPLYDKLHDKVPNKIPNKVPNKLRNEFPDITDSTWDVFMLLNTTHTATAEEIAAALGISSRMVRKHIATLKGAGIIVRVGSNKTGHWQVINKEDEEKSIQL